MNKIELFQKHLSSLEQLEKTLKTEQLLSLNESIHHKEVYSKLKEDIDALQHLNIELKKLQKDFNRHYDTLNSSLKEIQRNETSKLYERHLLYKPNIEIEQLEKDSILKGHSLYKYIWIFLFSSFIGFLFESIFTILKTGIYTNHAGLLFGPFNIVYGFGGIALTFFLSRFKKRNKRIIFLYSMLIGSTVEYVFSFFQELIFKSTSWNYEAFLFDIDGRICLLYAIFWGIIGILWLKVFYPIMMNLLLKIPKSIIKKGSIIIVIFFLFNMIFSYNAFINWQRRLEHLPSSQFFEKYYPNEKMETYYPNLEFKK